MQSLSWVSSTEHRHLAWLTAARGRFRMARVLTRLRSPRRLVASVLAIAFFVVYLLNGILILSTRKPVDPAQMTLWLSGGMTIYLLYHAIRCAWSRKVVDLEFSEAERLWLGGAPVPRSSLAVLHLSNSVVAVAMKTILIVVAIACDVARLELLTIGIFFALLQLEVCRLTIQRWTTGLNERHRSFMRIAVTSIGVALSMQVLARILAETPMGSPTWKYFINGFAAIGDTASSTTIMWLSVPWSTYANLATYSEGGCVPAMLVAFGIIKLVVFSRLLAATDKWSSEQRLLQEQQRLACGDFHRSADSQSSEADITSEQQTVDVIVKRLPDWIQNAVYLIQRQWISVRRYKGTILFSFIVPTLLCLSPLVTGQVTEQWFYVVGGIALCTMLLAPPALRIDFRRDLKRMLLLRSLPARPLSMVIGQLALPVLITLCFQWITITIAALVTNPGMGQFIMWAGMLSALAVFTFATENALFLAYPHHERAEGIGMMIRAKLTFLGKAAVIAMSLACLVAWATICRATFSPTVATWMLVVGSIVVTWLAAAASVYVATWCWRRFDVCYDVPPE